MKLSLSRILPLALMAPAAIWAGLAVALDVTGSHATPDEEYDAIVVAGCRVNPGGVASGCLERRTRRGVSLWQAGVAPRIVFTGGVGTFPPAEAVVAAQIARSEGVPDDAMVIEDRSTSTAENAAYAAEQVGAGRIVVVTDAWHTHRVKRVFDNHFDEVDAVGVDNRWTTRSQGAMREVLAISYYAVTGRL